MNVAMLEWFRRNTLMLIGLVATGTVFVFVGPVLTSPRGAFGPTVLHAASPLQTIVIVVVAFLIASVLAGVIGRLVNAAVGAFVLGGGLFALAYRMAGVNELVFSTGGFAGLGWETLLWAALTMVGIWIVFRIAGPLPDIHPDIESRIPHSYFSSKALIQAAPGVAVLPAVWLIAQSDMKGQVIAAVFIGSVAAGLAGRLISPHVQPKLVFVSPIVFGAIGHFVAAWTLDLAPELAVVTHEVPTWLLPMPIDYAVGSLTGVAFGLGWANSFLEHEEEVEEKKVRETAKA